MTSHHALSQIIYLSQALRLVKHLVSDADNRIQQYTDVFKKLRSQFSDYAILYTEITVVRILEQVQDLSGCNFKDY